MTSLIAYRATLTVPATRTPQHTVLATVLRLKVALPALTTAHSIHHPMLFIVTHRANLCTWTLTTMSGTSLADLTLFHKSLRTPTLTSLVQHPMIHTIATVANQRRSALDATQHSISANWADFTVKVVIWQTNVTANCRLTSFAVIDASRTNWTNIQEIGIDARGTSINW